MPNKLFSRRAGVREGLLTLLLLATLVVAFLAPVAPARAATEDQFLNALRGIGSRLRSAQVMPLTMVAGATVSGSVSLPVGSWIQAVKFETPTAISGSPTNINCRVGTAAAGQEVVADTDAKAQGHITATMVAAFDVVGNNASAVFGQCAAVGGTNPAGTVNVVVDYSAPVR